MSLTTMRVDTTLAAEALAARAARTAADATPRTAFATALRTASAPTTSSTAASTGTGAETTESEIATKTEAATSSAAGEKTRPVEGKLYEEITSGPRKGMFINRSGNAREGEAFVLVEKPGRDVHIYGTGKDRKTVVQWHNDDPAATKVPKGEVSRDVEG